ncbi:hypothetical protein, conserved [Plasmodium gonderi]|uniref:Uncharacterized protein n=1 Tax=Plasmodium gonderi TaxID=77519 RepID=A0A1Y1JCG2_PLAGO|nr:hypothetical protein, conserved [Plasmodium gonderi]GAW80209.1 hypothetical protein, conserved [Plasmodium gonderi]
MNKDDIDGLNVFSRDGIDKNQKIFIQTLEIENAETEVETNETAERDRCSNSTLEMLSALSIHGQMGGSNENGNHPKLVEERKENGNGKLPKLVQESKGIANLPRPIGVLEGEYPRAQSGEDSNSVNGKNGLNNANAASSATYICNLDEGVAVPVKMNQNENVKARLNEDSQRVIEEDKFALHCSKEITEVTDTCKKNAKTCLQLDNSNDVKEITCNYTEGDKIKSNKKFTISNDYSNSCISTMHNDNSDVSVELLRKNLELDSPNYEGKNDSVKLSNFTSILDVISKEGDANLLYPITPSGTIICNEELYAIEKYTKEETDVMDAVIKSVITTTGATTTGATTTGATTTGATTTGATTTSTSKGIQQNEINNDFINSENELIYSFTESINNFKKEIQEKNKSIFEEVSKRGHTFILKIQQVFLSKTKNIFCTKCIDQHGLFNNIHHDIFKEILKIKIEKHTNEIYMINLLKKIKNDINKANYMIMKNVNQHIADSHLTIQNINKDKIVLIGTIKNLEHNLYKMKNEQELIMSRVKISIHKSFLNFTDYIYHLLLNIYTSICEKSDKLSFLINQFKNINLERRNNLKIKKKNKPKKEHQIGDTLHSDGLHSIKKKNRKQKRKKSSKMITESYASSHKERYRRHSDNFNSSHLSLKGENLEGSNSHDMNSCTSNFSLCLSNELCYSDLTHMNTNKFTNKRDKNKGRTKFKQMLIKKNTSKDEKKRSRSFDNTGEEVVRPSNDNGNPSSNKSINNKSTKGRDKKLVDKVKRNKNCERYKRDEREKQYKKLYYEELQKNKTLQFLLANKDEEIAQALSGTKEEVQRIKMFHDQEEKKMAKEINYLRELIENEEISNKKLVKKNEELDELNQNLKKKVETSEYSEKHLNNKLYELNILLCKEREKNKILTSQNVKLKNAFIRYRNGANLFHKKKYGHIRKGFMNPNPVDYVDFRENDEMVFYNYFHEELESNPGSDAVSNGRSDAASSGRSDEFNNRESYSGRNDGMELDSIIDMDEENEGTNNRYEAFSQHKNKIYGDAIDGRFNMREIRYPLIPRQPKNKLPYRKNKKGIDSLCNNKYNEPYKRYYDQNPFKNCKLNSRCFSDNSVDVRVPRKGHSLLRRQKKKEIHGIPKNEKGGQMGKTNGQKYEHEKADIISYEIRKDIENFDEKKYKKVIKNITKEEKEIEKIKEDDLYSIFMQNWEESQMCEENRDKIDYLNWSGSFMQHLNCSGVYTGQRIGIYDIGNSEKAENAECAETTSLNATNNIQRDYTNDEGHKYPKKNNIHEISTRESKKVDQENGQKNGASYFYLNCSEENVKNVQFGEIVNSLSEMNNCTGDICIGVNGEVGSANESQNGNQRDLVDVEQKMQHEQGKAERNNEVITSKGKNMDHTTSPTDQGTDNLNVQNGQSFKRFNVINCAERNENLCVEEGYNEVIMNYETYKKNKEKFMHLSLKKKALDADREDIMPEMNIKKDGNNNKSNSSNCRNCSNNNNSNNSSAILDNVLNKERNRSSSKKGVLYYTEKQEGLKFDKNCTPFQCIQNERSQSNGKDMAQNRTVQSSTIHSVCGEMDQGCMILDNSIDVMYKNSHIDYNSADVHFFQMSKNKKVISMENSVDMKNEEKTSAGSNIEVERMKSVKMSHYYLDSKELTLHNVNNNTLCKSVTSCHGIQRSDFLNKKKNLNIEDIIIPSSNETVNCDNHHQNNPSHMLINTQWIKNVECTFSPPNVCGPRNDTYNGTNLIDQKKFEIMQNEGENKLCDYSLHEADATSTSATAGAISSVDEKLKLNERSQGATLINCHQTDEYTCNRKNKMENYTHDKVSNDWGNKNKMNNHGCTNEIVNAGLEQCLTSSVVPNRDSCENVSKKKSVGDRGVLSRLLRRN